MGREVTKAVLGLGVVLGLASAATAQTIATNVAPAANPAVWHYVDDKSGLDVRVSRDGANMVFEVSEKGVSVRKSLGSGRSVTTLKSGKDAVTIAIESGAVAVSRGGKTLKASNGHPVPFDQLAALFAKAPAALDAKRLLERMSLTPGSPVGNALLLTRALLETATGASDSLTAYKGWATTVAAKPRLMTVQKSSDPGWCWDTYAKEAIEIANEYIDCLKNLKWYDIFGGYACDALYVIQAELAMLWLLNCSGPIPIK